ncbi:MAG: Asp-tRNA(Asn)/Glu-tRNA(Gln) amidotransferase subunit GatC [Candidatus Pacebacteria bacterium]|nr:Asp-tRNA(Asn)/Glu-tRNA(Gln) amidotransferase subunit GatC [Candidatus Paceibacterota bacterium]
MAKTTISPHQVKHVAQLANIPISKKEEQELTQAFTETLAVVNQLKSLKTKNVQPTHQVTGLENILRADKVDQEKMFTQEQALANASQTHQGYFVVPRIIEKQHA